MSDPLISVIVPIYNVDKYVRKCLDSLKNQTMKQIEVICIDDGSTDESGRIAEEYKNEEGWPRFRIIHTENRGLSAARNRGLDEARAGWIMFVDSDDWVEDEFCRVPYTMAAKENADLVIFEAYRTTESGRIRKTKQSKKQSGVVNSEEVIMNSVAWNKLYKRDLFNNIRYPEGYVFEDIATTHKLTHKAKNIFWCEDRLYYHRKWKGSISRSVSSRADEYAAKIQRYNDLFDWGYATKEDRAILQAVSLDYCGQAMRTDDHLYQTAVDLVGTIDKIPDEFDMKHKLKLLIWKTNRNAYRGIYHACGKQMTQTRE